ncbi:hypothetical protein SAMN02982990_04300 [Photorhabdus luminescens]|uniref:Uncharacterized protein n=1 Tax=Photorhabdus luminescens TaxID=29488 RepID=A0A1G5RHT3_PHOLU|nr:hypothetical protein SAMN02982990_04300 [Photorhabdus luminescens]
MVNGDVNNYYIIFHVSSWAILLSGISTRQLFILNLFPGIIACKWLLSKIELFEKREN